MPIYGPAGEVLADDRVRADEILVLPAPEGTHLGHASLALALARCAADPDGTLPRDVAERMWRAAAAMDPALLQLSDGALGIHSAEFERAYADVMDAMGGAGG